MVSLLAPGNLHFVVNRYKLVYLSQVQTLHHVLSCELSSVRCHVSTVGGIQP